MNLNELNYRSVEVSDTAAIFDLVIECEQAEYGSHDSSMEDLLHDLESTHPASDSWLVFNSEGVLIGYALLMPWFGNLRYDFFITPSWQDPNLGTELLRHCDQRAKAMLTESPQNDPVNAVCYIANVNERDRKSVIASGFSLSKHIFQMQIEMTESIPEPRWPDGISIRNVNPGKDNKSVHELIETAFSRPDRTPSRFDEWQNAMLRSDIFDPTLWFLATYEDELVGACLGYEYPEQGWVRQLGVIPAWRGKGLGSALLRHAFHTFQERNYTKVGLTVDSHNENAYKFYQRLGMQRVRQYEQHEKILVAP